MLRNVTKSQEFNKIADKHEEGKGIGMDFEGIVKGFQSFLFEKYPEMEAKSKKNDFYSPEVSIFTHSNDFKEYLLDENIADVSIFSKSINDIMSMDIENGKLVAIQNDSDNTKNEDDKNSDGGNFLVDALNGLFSDELIKTALDTNEDTKLDENEIKSFLEGLAEENENGEITFDGISEGLKKILPEDETSDTQKADEAEKTDEISKDEEQKKDVDTIKDEDKSQDVETNNTGVSNQTASAPVASSGGGNISSGGGSVSSGGGVSSGVGLSSGTASNLHSIKNNNSSIDNMTLDELQSERTEKQTAVDNAQKDYNDVYSGKNDKVKDAQSDYDDAKDAYDEAVKNDDKIPDKLKKSREDNLHNIEKTQKNIDDLKIKINDQEIEISDKESQIDDDTANIAALKEAKSALEGQSDSSGEVSQKIAELESKIAEAESAKETHESELDNLKQQLNEYNDNLESEEAALSDFEQERDEIENEIEKSCSTETKEAMKTFNKAKDNLESIKETEAKTAQKALNEAQTSLKEIDNKRREKKAEEVKNENAVYSGSINPELAEKLDSQLGSGFCSEIEKLADELKCNPEDLLTMMYSESGLDPSAGDGVNSAGLTQFIAGIAEIYGTTCAELKNMSALEQMPYIRQSLISCKEMTMSSDTEVDTGTLYAMNFLPAYANREILCSSGDAYYNANYPLDFDGDGNISKTDLANHLEKKRSEMYAAFGVSM